MPPLSMRRRGLGLVIAGPSGVGKSAIARALLQAEPEVSLSVSMTTRPQRSGEADAKHYHFRSLAEFAAAAESGELLEWAEVFGHRYGTPRAPVEQAFATGRDVLFVIDWQGHRKLRAALPGDIVGVAVLPTALGVLAERLAARGDTAAAIARRMQTAPGEIAHWNEFDHVIINHDLSEAVHAVREILHAARLTPARQPDLADFVAGLG